MSMKMYIFLIDSHSNQFDDDFHNRRNAQIQVRWKRKESTMGMDLVFRKDRIQLFIPMITMVVFLIFAFVLAAVVILSIIPIYLHDESVERTGIILTSKIW